MSYFLLPQITNNINNMHIDNINVVFSEKTPQIAISHTVHKYLSELKKNIDNISSNWDIFKKYTNPYEYIHTAIPGTKKSVSKFNPVSRSYYKLIEIANLLHLFNDSDTSIQSFHLAEGPGGFIEAMVYIRNNYNDLYTGMTLIDDNISIPGWKKNETYFKNKPFINIENGADNTGNLFNWENFLHCNKHYKGKMNFITGDGGFDYSIDFNKQEILSTKLVLVQLMYALTMQKNGGNFVLKIFDVFTQAMIDILFLISNCYEKVYIIKPFTSRRANSERYVVCKNFNQAHNVANIIDKLRPVFFNEINIHRILNIKIPHIFMNKLNDINAIIGQQQMENISSTISLINQKNKDKIDNMRKINIQKCITWCQKNKVQFNKQNESNNIFLSNR